MENRYPGKIAEYGSDEFKNNQAIFTILDSGISVNPHGIERKVELYHRSEGYKLAGSCATWGREVWGVKIYFDDGTTGGHAFDNLLSAEIYFYALKKK